MSKKDEALKLALEALEYRGSNSWRKRQPAITALREALAEQPAQQEPVAVVSGYYGGQCVILPIDPARIFNSNTALYTSPPAQRTWVGLTDEEIEKLVTDAGFTRSDLLMLGACVDQVARLVEAKLKEKNT